MSRIRASLYRLGTFVSERNVLHMIFYTLLTFHPGVQKGTEDCLRTEGVYHNWDPKLISLINFYSLLERLWVQIAR